MPRLRPPPGGLRFGASRQRALGEREIAPAAGITGVLDLLATGKIPDRGFIRQEDIELDTFLANRFGRAYAPR